MCLINRFSAHIDAGTTATATAIVGAGLEREVDLASLGIDLTVPPEPVGMGGFGRVFRCRWRQTDVAVKMVNVGHADDDAQLVDFRQEIDLVLSLPGHRNIVHAMAAHTKLPNLALVMEWMTDGSLADVLHGKRKRDLTLRQRFNIVIDICSGLCFLHCGEPQILHRDLKPENVMINEHLVAKLTDFGLSRIKNKSLMQSTRIGGTASFMAPESHIAGTKLTDKIDVYS